MYEEHMKSHPEAELASTAGNKPSPDPQSADSEDLFSVSGSQTSTGKNQNKREDAVVNNMMETHDSSVNISEASSTTGGHKGMLGSASSETSEGRKVSSSDLAVTRQGYSVCSLPRDPVHISDEGASPRTDNLLPDTDNMVQSETSSYSHSGINTRLLFPDAASFPTSKPAVHNDIFPSQSETFRNETSVLEKKSIPIHSDRGNSSDKFQDCTTSIPYNSDVDYHGDNKMSTSESHNEAEGGDNKASLQVWRSNNFCAMFNIFVDISQGLKHKY